MPADDYPYESNVLGELDKEGFLVKQKLHKLGARAWQVTTAPTVEPVTTDEVKDFGRIDGTREDTLLTSFISTVRDAVESYLGRAFITQTITTWMDWWPGTKCELPRPPLISVSSVATLDEDDVATTYSTDNYYVLTGHEPGMIIIRNGSAPPTNTDRYHGGYRVISTHGYGASASDVPSLIKEAIKAWITEFYETRVFDPKKPPPNVRGLLDYSDYMAPRL